MQNLLRTFAIWSRDPGYGRLGHALSTVGGVGLAYLIITSLHLSEAVFGLMAAAILAQCTVGNSPRQRKTSMAIAGFLGGALALIGSLATLNHPYAGYGWMVVVAFAAYMSAGLGGRWVVMPRFVTVLVLFGTVLPISLAGLGHASLSYLIGFASAFVAYFYVLPDHKLPFLQSTLHLTFGRIADLIETQEEPAQMQEATRVASGMLDSAQDVMEEARNGRWGQGDLIDAASELVLILRELYTDGRFMQRFLSQLRKLGEGELFFTVGHEATRGLRAAGVAVNVASQRSTLPVYNAVGRVRETLQEIVGSFEEAQIGAMRPPAMIRASNFVAAGQSFCVSLERAAELIDRLQHPTIARKL